MDRILLLTNGGQAIVSEEDYARVSAHRWWAQHEYRSGQRRVQAVVTKIKGELVLLHRFILKPGPGFVVDHKDRDPLNNQRANLRACSRQENAQNCGPRSHSRSGLKGVYCDSTGAKPRWRAQIVAGGRKANLGSFPTAAAAADAYDRAAKRLHGSFAVLNADLAKAA